MTDMEKAYRMGFCYMFIIIIIIIFIFIWVANHLCKDVDIFFKTNYVLICDILCQITNFFSGIRAFVQSFLYCFSFFV